ncbi:MAG: DUF4175 family protein [Acidobacteriota bacterium]|nr:DUF4175 family protein [Acidobacteriota bacterium]
MSELSAVYDELMLAIRTTRRRWRIRVLLRGLAIVAGSGFAAFAVSVWAMDRFHYSDTSVTVVRVLIWLSLLGLLVRFLVLPLSRRVNDRQVALYIEESEPTLQSELLSAIEFGAEARQVPGGDRGAAPSEKLVRKLLEKAILSCQALDYGASIERGALRRGSAMLSGVAMAAVVAVLLSPALLRHGALLLFMPWSGAAAENPYSIGVMPGSVTVARGADQEVRAVLDGFDSEATELAIRRGDNGEWERWPMMPAGGVETAEGSEKVVMLLDLQEASEYYVEAEGVRSELHRIEVADLPYVDRIAMEYHFPAYTGLSPQRFEESGDIAALRGTRVELEIYPTFPVGLGRLVLEGEEGAEDMRILEADENGVFRGSVDVTLDAFYRIDLEGPAGELMPSSPEYIIEVLEDQPPVISFSEPGRDIKAHKLEEVFSEVKVEDDYGISRVELRYSVNGEQEQSVVLLSGRQKPRDAQIGHTFYLEEYELEDGDFISYYARANDAGDSSKRATVTTDIYFVEISPFAKNYRQAQQQGGMGGGGEMDNALSRRQRQIVAATFKLVRDKNEYAASDYDENLTTVALMQGRLREQVANLISRMQNRLRDEADFQGIIENLGRGAAEMVPAEERLGEKKPDEALAPEQRALKFLQRAEATFRDVQVSFQQGGMGGDGQRMAEDLADLFELELDKLHNQYETVERGERQQVQEQVDEALQKLKELARRQEQENERARRMASQNGGASSGSRSQRELIEETEDLARRLERLARERSRPDLQQTARRLQDAADSMKQAMANRRGGETARGSEALEELKRARRLLEKNREFELAAEMDDLKERSSRARRMQEKISDEVSSLDPTSDRSGFQGQLESILEQKDQLGEEVSSLENQIDRVARQSRGTQKGASRALSQASESIRENQLKEKIRYSKGVVRGRSPEYAQRFETEIGQDLDEMGERLAEAGEAMGASPENRQDDALEQARELVRRLESFQSRLEDRGMQRRADMQGEQVEQQGQGQKGQQEGGQQPGQQQGGQQASGGQRGQPGGQQGGAAANGGFRTQIGQGGTPGWYQPGIFTPEDLRQMGAEFQQRLGDAQDLQRDLSQLGISSQDLEDVLRKMRDFNVRGINNDPLALESLRAQVVEGLRQFEYRLWRDLVGEGEERLYLAGADEVPPGFRELVEKYYENLSETD